MNVLIFHALSLSKGAWYGSVKPERDYPPYASGQHVGGQYVCILQVVPLPNPGHQLTAFHPHNRNPNLNRNRTGFPYF